MQYVYVTKVSTATTKGRESACETRPLCIQNWISCCIPVVYTPHMLLRSNDSTHSLCGVQISRARAYLCSTLRCLCIRFYFISSNVYVLWGVSGFRFSMELIYMWFDLLVCFYYCLKMHIKKITFIWCIHFIIIVWYYLLWQYIPKLLFLMQHFSNTVSILYFRCFNILKYFKQRVCHSLGSIYTS